MREIYGNYPLKRRRRGVCQWQVEGANLRSWGLGIVKDYFLWFADSASGGACGSAYPREN